MPSENTQRLAGALTTIEVPIPSEDSGDIATFFSNNAENLHSIVESVFHGYQQVRPPSFKTYVDMHLRLVREVPNEEPQFRDVYLRSNIQVISHDNIASYVSELSNYFVKRFDDDMGEEEGSGFTLDSIVSEKLSFSLIMLHSRIGEYVPYPKGVPGKGKYSTLQDPRTVFSRCLQLIFIKSLEWK